MNAPLRLFTPGTLALAVLVAAGGLGGCSTEKTFAFAKIDPNSAVAPDVARIVHANAPFPTFASIPPEPKDVRPARAWGQAAAQVVAAGAKLDAATAPSTWTLTGTDEFAEKVRKAAGAAPPNADSTSPATQAYAEALRKRATPPPPPKR